MSVVIVAPVHLSVYLKFQVVLAFLCRLPWVAQDPSKPPTDSNQSHWPSSPPPALRSRVHPEHQCWPCAGANSRATTSIPLLEYHLRHDTEPQVLCTIIRKWFRHRDRYGKIHTCLWYKSIIWQFFETLIWQTVRNGIYEEHQQQLSEQYPPGQRILQRREPRCNCTHPSKYTRCRTPSREREH